MNLKMWQASTDSAKERLKFQNSKSILSETEKKRVLL